MFAWNLQGSNYGQIHQMASHNDTVKQVTAAESSTSASQVLPEVPDDRRILSRGQHMRRVLTMAVAGLRLLVHLSIWVQGSA
jgi:hypothetical protein